MPTATQLNLPLDNEIGTLARARRAIVVFGGIHATLYQDEARELGGAHAVVKGDGDLVWPVVMDDVTRGTLKPVYEGGRVDGSEPSTRSSKRSWISGGVGSVSSRWPTTISTR